MAVIIVEAVIDYVTYLWGYTSIAGAAEYRTAAATDIAFELLITID